MDDLDPLVALERLIESRTCEVCGDTLDQPIVRVWWCHKVERGGFISKHWKNWRVCPRCVTMSAWGQFSKFIFPVIANMNTQSLAEQLVAVQPMQQPAPQMMYLDFVVGAEGARLNRPNRNQRVYGVDLANPCGERTLVRVHNA